MTNLRNDLKLDVLLLGCGNVHNKRIKFSGDLDDPAAIEKIIGRGSPWEKFEDYSRLHLHDIDPELCTKFDHKVADGSVQTFALHDLNALPYPWDDESFDEIHAYEVLEHCGSQGDGDFFFGQFNEFWRMLKPGGYFMLSVPMWDAEVAWGVPDHRRVMPPGLFGFLTEDYYENVGKKEGYGDYRSYLDGRYWVAVAKHESEEQLHVVLRKPFREDG